MKGWWVHLILAANHSDTMCVDIPLLLTPDPSEKDAEQGVLSEVLISISPNLRKYPTDTIHIKWISFVMGGNFEICGVGGCPIPFIKAEISCLGVASMELYLFMDSTNND